MLVPPLFAAITYAIFEPFRYLLLPARIASFISLIKLSVLELAVCLPIPFVLLATNQILCALNILVVTQFSIFISTFN
jgi:hypothetical protein